MNLRYKSIKADVLVLLWVASGNVCNLVVWYNNLLTNPQKKNSSTLDNFQD